MSDKLLRVHGTTTNLTFGQLHESQFPVGAKAMGRSLAQFHGLVKANGWRVHAAIRTTDNKLVCVFVVALPELRGKEGDSWELTDTQNNNLRSNLSEFTVEFVWTPEDERNKGYFKEFSIGVNENLFTTTPLQKITAVKIDKDAAGYDYVKKRTATANHTELGTDEYGFELSELTKEQWTTDNT